MGASDADWTPLPAPLLLSCSALLWWWWWLELWPLRLSRSCICATSVWMCSSSSLLCTSNCCVRACRTSSTSIVFPSIRQHGTVRQDAADMSPNHWPKADNDVINSHSAFGKLGSGFFRRPCFLEFTRRHLTVVNATFCISDNKANRKKRERGSPGPRCGRPFQRPVGPARV